MMMLSETRFGRSRRSGGRPLCLSRSLLGFMLCAFLLAPSLSFAQIELGCLEDPLPAGCVTYEFEFEAQTVTDPFALFGAIGFGSLISGNITVNTNVQDLDPSDADRGVYPGAIECARIVLDDQELVLVQEPFVPDITGSGDDPGYVVENDMPDLQAPLTSLVDFVAGSIAGPGFLGPVGGSSSLGGGAFVFTYSEACVDIPFSPFPCPPMIVVDDSIPPAPGDTSMLPAAPVSLVFAQVEGTLGSAQVDGQLLSLDAAPPTPCPEPGFGLALAVGVLGILGIVGVGGLAAPARRSA